MCCSDCLSEVNIQNVILKIENMVGSLCGCDPNYLIDDTIPDIIRFTSPNIYPIDGGPIQVISIGTIIPPVVIPEPELTDFDIQDFNPQQFN